MFCSCRVLSSRATEDEDPHASNRCLVAFVPYGAQRVRKDNGDRRNGYVVIKVASILNMYCLRECVARMSRIWRGR